MRTESLVGLTSQEVAERVERGEVNTLPPRSGRTVSGIVKANVFTRVNLILAVLFLCVLTTGQLLQGMFAMLIIANSIIGIIQELRAKRTLDRLAVVGEARPEVIRDGVRTSILRDEVVLGDLIILAPGGQIVVDGEVVTAQYLEVDESLLTGEADPIAKVPGDEVMSGAFVVSGSGVYRATKVGADAYAAQITAQAAKFTLVSSELRQGIDQILKYVSWLLIPVGVLSIWVQFAQPGTTWQQAVLGMTASLVPMVPEGLVLLTAMAFALGVIRLGKRNVLVQELPAIEGLARVDVVCADKTGTLTQNAMTLGEILPVVGDEAGARAVLAQLVAADDTPNASMQAIALGVEPASDPWQVTARAPFTSAKKWSGVSFGDRNIVLGAPDVLAEGQVASQAEEVGSTGRRVLLLGSAELPVDSADAPGRVAPLALVVLDQLVRPDAADTLAYFQDQRVRLKVISGDNAASVGAVTRSLGVDLGEVVDARTLPEPSEAFTERVENAGVFGRVTPEQKRQMVSALQSRGHNVAMTGDGVNDVLALKDADLGVAMGSGAAATRSVAQLVLLDDKFAQLPHVVAEGRRVIGNIERVAKLFLTKTIYSVTLALIFGLVAVPFPFQPLHVTVVGWFTIGIPAFLLSLAPNKELARPGFVSRTLSLAVPAGVAVAAATIVAYLWARGLGEVPMDLQLQASTAALTTMIIVATWVLSVVARPYRLWRLALVAFAYAFYGVLIHWPVTASILNLDTANWHTMLVAYVAGAVGVGVVELIWWLRSWLTGEPARLLPEREA
ncbi:HAD-IC family P-type ATPase [Tessaracoccus sp. OH4464_COT-324]|uniref:HAD-IC family P-type ATPase n=1 Tax=Tessaracoccus sp. OH4464_COT-324 TaxID=2491059 RepID=UPI000F6318C2|nr:HAD-IC family P-type ATPase [Tessaracoccus sp. OH4464_COT-324]RRD47561.1 HAD family hydrolase [Tessaracoccus sp. OH4464_COT-324]